MKVLRKSMFFFMPKLKCPNTENVDWIRSCIFKLLSNQMFNRRGYNFILVIVLSNI